MHPKAARLQLQLAMERDIAPNTDCFLSSVTHAEEKILASGQQHLHCHLDWQKLYSQPTNCRTLSNSRQRVINPS